MEQGNGADRKGHAVPWGAPLGGDRAVQRLRHLLIHVALPGALPPQRRLVGGPIHAALARLVPPRAHLLRHLPPNHSEVRSVQSRQMAPVRGMRRKATERRLLAAAHLLGGGRGAGLQLVADGRGEEAVYCCAERADGGRYLILVPGHRRREDTRGGGGAQLAGHQLCSDEAQAAGHFRCQHAHNGRAYASPGGFECEIKNTLKHAATRPDERLVPFRGWPREPYSAGTYVAQARHGLYRSRHSAPHAAA